MSRMTAFVSVDCETPMRIMRAGDVTGAGDPDRLIAVCSCTTQHWSNLERPTPQPGMNGRRAH